MTHQYVSGVLPTEPRQITTTAEDRQPKQTSADFILIPKPLRAEWLDVIGADPAVSFAAAKVAMVIGAHFNRYSGDTFISQDTIAAMLDCGVSTVQRAIEQLEELGYIAVQRRELDRRTAEGRRICGGRGIANVYFPALDRARMSAMNAGSKLRDRFDALSRRAEQRKTQRRKVVTGDQVSAVKGGQSRPPLEAERWSKMTGNLVTGDVPTLNHPTDDNPAAVSAGAALEAPAASAEEPAATLASSRAIAPELEAPELAIEGAPAEAAMRPVLAEVPVELPHEFAARLEARLGAAYASWFRDVRVIAFDYLRSTLVLSAPTRFVADWISTRHDFYILDAWNGSRHLTGTPPAERLEMKVIAGPAAKAAT